MPWGRGDLKTTISGACTKSYSILSLWKSLLIGASSHSLTHVVTRDLQPQKAMASNLPIPAPPRTPTPPPEDDDSNQGNGGMGPDGYLNSPAKATFDPNSLSPMGENFPTGRYGSTPAFPLQSATFPNPLGPTDTNASSQYSPMSLDSPGSAGSAGSVLQENAKGVFKFQPTSLSTSPIAKSVSFNYAGLHADY